MNKNLKTYWKLFTATFALSAFTFGGGYVIVPLMKKKFVDEFKWLEEEDMLNMTAIAQSAPGPIAVNASILVGYRICGIIGAIITIFGTILPPFIIISLIYPIYNYVRDNAVVAAVLKGMQAGVAAVICDVVIGMAGKILKEKQIRSNVIMVLVFIVAYFSNINVSLIVVACGIFGALHTTFILKKKGTEKVGEDK